MTPTLREGSGWHIEKKNIAPRPHVAGLWSAGAFVPEIAVFPRPSTLFFPDKRPAWAPGRGSTVAVDRDGMRPRKTLTNVFLLYGSWDYSSKRAEKEINGFSFSKNNQE